MTASRIRALHLAAEGTYGTDPDSDGSDYLPLRCTGLFDPVDGTEIENVGGATGRNEPPEMTVTRSGAKLDLVIPLYGYATGSGDGDAAPTTDVLDLVFNNAYGAAIQATGGEGVAASSTTSNVILDAAISGLTAGSLLPVYMASTPAQTLFRRVGTVATATYPVFPDWAVAPLTAAVAYGARGWGQANQLQTAGASLAAAVNVGGQIHRLLGGRVTAISGEAVAGKIANLNVSLMFDSYESNVTMASLPAITTFPAPIVQALAPFYWNGTQYQTKSLKIDFGLKSVALEAVSGANGRANIDVVEIDPVITVEPAWAPGTWNAAFAAGTVGEVLCQIGGRYTSGRPNAFAMHGLRAQIMAPPTNSDDGGYLRESVQIKVLGSGADAARRWEFARC